MSITATTSTKPITKCLHQSGAFAGKAEWTTDYDKHDWCFFWDGFFTIEVCSNCQIRYAKC